MTLKVLAIDDSRTIRELLRQVMEAAGFHFAAASDGVEGVARYAELRPDVVITDINMPVMDGIELIRALRAESAYRHTPILMLTTEAGPDRKKEGKDAGATGWIVKPFDPAQLVATMHRVLR